MRPSPSQFTRREWRIVETCRTPALVQRFLTGLPYNHETPRETLRSFREVVRHSTAQCLEAALCAAVILEQHGYPPLLLDLESQDNLDHVLFLFQERGCWGTVGRSRDPGLHGRRPVFRTLRELVDSYADPFVDLSGRIVGYGVCCLDDLGRYDWRFSERNMWKVQDHLCEMPHRRYRMGERRYQLWLARYRAFKDRYPGRKPLFYAGRRRWLAPYPRG